jgi:chromosome segregation ATPase
LKEEWSATESSLRAELEQAHQNLSQQQSKFDEQSAKVGKLKEKYGEKLRELNEQVVHCSFCCCYAHFIVCNVLMRVGVMTI